MTEPAGMSHPRPPPGAPKGEWRRWARARRAALDTKPLSVAVADHLRKWLAEASVGSVLFYLPLPGEIDLRSLPGRLPQLRFLVTRVPERGPLTVHPLASARERHPFGFDQPVADAAEVATGEVDAALVPGLAFDRRGVRLGFGKGYFDELLARLPAAAARIGVLAQALLVDELPAAAHDVRMSHLATEAGVEVVGEG